MKIDKIAIATVMNVVLRSSSVVSLYCLCLPHDKNFCKQLIFANAGKLMIHDYVRCMSILLIFIVFIKGHTMQDAKVAVPRGAMECVDSRL